MRIFKKIFGYLEKKRCPWIDNPSAGLGISLIQKRWYHVFFNIKQYFIYLGKMKKRFGIGTAIYIVIYDLMSKLWALFKLAVKVSLVCIVLSLFTKGTFRSADIPYGEVRTVYYKTSWAMEGDTIVYETNDKKAVGKVVDTHITKAFDKKGLTATLEDGTVVDFSQIKGIYWGEYTLITAYKDLTEEERQEDMGIHGEVDSKGELFYGLFKFVCSFRDDYTMFDRIEVGAKGTFYIARGLLFRGLALSGLYSS